MTTLEDVLHRRAQYKAAGYPLRQSMLCTNNNRLELSYYILPQQLCPELPFFAVAVVADDHSDALYGVADTIRTDLQPYTAAHEVFCRKEKKGCLVSIKEELNLLELLNKQLITQHLETRLQLFIKLPDYARTHGYAEQQIEAFEQTRAYLLERLTQISPSRAKKIFG